MLSLLDLLRRIDAGETTPGAAVREAHMAIADRDGDLRAFASVDGSAQAAADGPLRGVAVGLKDIIDTANMPTEMGTPIYAGWRRARTPRSFGAPPRRGDHHRQDYDHGVRLSRSDPDAQPAQSGHTPGGSSSGSAAAVGAGMIPLALGPKPAAR